MTASQSAIPGDLVALVCFSQFTMISTECLCERARAFVIKAPKVTPDDTLFRFLL